MKFSSSLVILLFGHIPLPSTVENFYQKSNSSSNKTFDKLLTCTLPVVFFLHLAKSIFFISGPYKYDISIKTYLWPTFLIKTVLICSSEMTPDWGNYKMEPY